MAAVIAQNCLRELNKFENTVLYALDLYDNVEALSNYCFGNNKELLDILSNATKDKQILTECSSIVIKLLKFVEHDLFPLFKKGSIKMGLSREDECLLIERIKLFWEIYKCRTIEGLIPMSGLCELDTTMDQIENVTKNLVYLSFDNFPLPLREHLKKGSSASSKSLEPIYIREEVTVGSSNQEPENTENNFVSKIKKLEEKLKKKDYDVALMKSISADSLPEDFKLSTDSSKTVFKLLLPYWSNLYSKKNESNAKVFSEVLEKIFDLTGLKDKNALFHLLLEKLGSTKVYCYQSFIEQYSTRLTQYLNSLGDHNDLQQNVEKFANIQNKLLFFLLMSPYETTEKLILYSVDNKAVVPGVLKILQASSSLYAYSFNIAEGTKEPLLVTILKSIFEKEATRHGSVEFRDNYTYLVTSICRRKLALIREKGPDGQVVREVFGEVIEEALLNSSDILQFFILPKLLSASITSPERMTLLKIVHRILQCLGVKDTSFKWTNSVGSDWKKCHSVPAPELLILIHCFYSQYEKNEPEMSNLCRLILKALGTKLRDDKIVFCAKSSAFILNKLSQNPWWVRYCLIEWFGFSLGNPKQQIPCGLFQALPLSVQEKCEQIVVDFKSATVNCFLRSLFELGLFDVDMTLNLLKEGIAITPLPDLLVEQIAIALVDCTGRSYAAVRIASLTPLLNRLIELLGPFHCSNTLKYLSEFSYWGLQFIQPILIVAKAAQLAYLRVLNPEVGEDTPVLEGSLDKVAEPKLIAQELLQGFCELARAHMENEMTLLRRNKMCMSTNITGASEHVMTGLNYQRPAVVSIQLNVLFSQAVMFSQMSKTEIIPSLRILISLLSDFIVETNERQKARYLNDVELSYIKPKTVYAYASVNEGKTDNECKSEDEKPLLTAENHLFKIESSGFSMMPTSHSYQSIASQIGDPTIKTQTERRIEANINSKKGNNANHPVASKTEVPATQPGSENSTSVKKNKKKNNKKRF